MGDCENCAGSGVVEVFAGSPADCNDCCGSGVAPVPRECFLPGDRVQLAEGAPRVIGLCGAAGSGKSTAAEVLAAYGYTRLRFAGPLKAALRALLSSAGVSDVAIDCMIEGDLKEVPQAVLGGKSPRYAMQTLGTEWGRDLLGGDFWVNLTRRKVREILAAGGRVVIDDCRFPNEADLIASAWPVAPGDLVGGSSRAPGQLWLVTGRGGIAGGHESEGHLPHLLPDRFVNNSGSYADLARQVLDGVAG